VCVVFTAGIKRQFEDSVAAFQKNMRMVENFCELLTTRKVGQILFFSSAAVYGEETENINITEETPVNPTSFYGLSKYAAERMLQICCEKAAIPLVCLRPTLVYGPSDPALTYGPSGFSNAARCRRAITLWGDGCELREFIHVSDVCRVVEALIGSSHDGPLNVVSGTAYSFFDIINELKSLFPDLQVEERARTKKRVNNAFDARRIYTLLPPSFAFTPLRDGILDILTMCSIPETGATDSELLVDFGFQPVSNRFPETHESALIPRYPLQIHLWKKNGLVYQPKPFPVSELTPLYPWLTCFEPEDHLDALVSRLVGREGITKDSIFGAYSFKDDSTLRRLESLGYTNTWRLDPASDLGVQNPNANVETFQTAFTALTTNQVANRRGKSDVFIVRHVFEHCYNPAEFLAATRELVKPGGVVVFEIPDAAAAFNRGDCTTIWEEHTLYFSEATFHAYLRENRLSILDFWRVQYPLEDCLIVIADPHDCVPGELPEGDLESFLETAKKFPLALKRQRAHMKAFLDAEQAKGGEIAIFGAGHLSVAFLGLNGFESYVTAAIDDNPNKLGRCLPLGNIPILSSTDLTADRFSVCLLGANPQAHHKITQRNKAFSDSGGQFVSIFPDSDLYPL